VKLKSIIYGIVAEEGDEQGQRVSQAQEYLRGASTAIRELAPFNTFYAEARKVVIDQVETGGRSNSQIEEWRFCDVCSHTSQTR
jgi:DEAD/DEAH box helicase domain-containing protein